jgi:peptidoglycan/LPS O-acetylase OafA/YrhL
VREIALNAYPTDIRPLTSLRFFAAIAVVIYHYEWFTTRGGIFDGFSAGVDFFFILSGFVLMHAYRGKIEGGGFRYGDFLLKRLARIYPMHLATLLFYLALVLAFMALGKQPDNPERFSFAWLVPQLLLVGAWGPVDHGTWNYPAWSISAEWFAYLLFPLIAGFAFRRQVSAATVTVVAVVLTVVFVLASGPLLGAGFKHLHSNWGIYRIFPEFALGCALYRLGVDRPATVLGSLAAFWVLAAATVAAAFLDAPQLLLIALFALLILSAAETSRAGIAPLAGRLPVYLGEISYSVYMVHVPVATVFFKAAEAALGDKPFWLALVGVAVVTACSAATYELIEKPTRSLILSLTRKRGRQPQTSNA